MGRKAHSNSAQRFHANSNEAVVCELCDHVFCWVVMSMDCVPGDSAWHSPNLRTGGGCIGKVPVSNGDGWDGRAIGFSVYLRNIRVAR